MDKTEARLVLQQQVARYRKLSQADLLHLLEATEAFECSSPSGAVYQIEVEAMWDNESKRELRVMACIDDGGWRALRPLCDDFIIREDGSFVGE